jgi:DNA modification methylase
MVHHNAFEKGTGFFDGSLGIESGRPNDKGGPSRYFKIIKDETQTIEGKPMVNLICDDVLNALAKFQDNVYTGIFSDPPYGLSFNNHKWDYDLPSIKVFQELLRVTRPGGYMLMFGSPRTVHRLTVNIEDAGWEIRTTLIWLYGSGFPKGLNIGKKLPEFNGYNTQLKPAFEPIILAQKPLDGNFVLNAEKWGCGGLNVDETRIGTEERTFNSTTRTTETCSYDRPTGGGMLTPGGTYTGATYVGRYPSNVIIDENIAEELPIRYYYVPKTSTSERKAGCHATVNKHPTLKPIKLCSYLATLIRQPEENQLLVPYCGAGSEIIGAALAGWSHITGIDSRDDYLLMAQERIDHWTQKPTVASPLDTPQSCPVATEAMDEGMPVTPS